MLNRVYLIGNLGHDPEIRMMQEGREIATFSLATHSSWKDTKGEWQKTTEWHRITVYRPDIVLWVKNALKKGERVFLEGKLTYSEIDDKTTQLKRKIAHVVISGREGRLESLQSKKNDHETESAGRGESDETPDSSFDTLPHDLDEQLLAQIPN